MSSLQIFVSLIFIHHCKSIEGNVFHRGSDFMSVAKTDAFVDKTLFIKTIFENGPRQLITAPRKFGKSTNLNMLKIFLSKNTHNNETIRNRFTQLKMCISDQTFCYKNFATHPVVYLNLNAGTANSYQELINVYKRAMHESYLEHKYLKPVGKEKKLLKDWCGENSFNNMGEVDIIPGLLSLIHMLRKANPQKKIVVLIDDYDSVVNRALFELHDNDQFDTVVSLTSLILIAVTRISFDEVQLIVTGTSYISSIGLFHEYNFKRYYFLDDHPLADLHGLTHDEVTLLYSKDKFMRRSKKIKLVKEFYNGYTCKRGSHIYNTYSFLSYLETGEVIIHWGTDDYIQSVLETMKFANMAKIIDSLLSLHSVTTKFKLEINMRKVIDLGKVDSQRNTTINPDPDLILNHLLEIGLLTYDKIGNNSDLGVGEFRVKIPNLEVLGIIFENVKKYFTLKCNRLFSVSENYPIFKKKLHEHYNSTKGPCKNIVVSFIDALQDKY